MSESPLILQNHFLIAMPSLVDYYFTQAVIYVCAHSQAGTMGIIINRPMLGIHLGDMVAQMKIASADVKVNQQPVFLGGIVQPEQGFIVHSPSTMWQSTLVVSDAIGITFSQDILQAIAKGEGPKDNLIVLGCSGWGAGQLEEEISHNYWITVRADPNIIFHVPYYNRWQAALSLLGIDPHCLSYQAGHA